jgi:hypothetical protein
MGGPGGRQGGIIGARQRDFAMDIEYFDRDAHCVVESSVG